MSFPLGVAKVLRGAGLQAGIFFSTFFVPT